MSKPKQCDCPRCHGVKTADPKWGFDVSAVPTVHCLMCNRPIGKRPYRLETGMARFGIMQFVHVACDPDTNPGRGSEVPAVKRQPKTTRRRAAAM
jgi:hypothetical protein